MKIALYSRIANDEDLPVFSELFEILNQYNIEFVLEKRLAKQLVKLGSVLENSKTFSNQKDLQFAGVDQLLSIGGDGTLLDTLEFVHHTRIPVLGINTGRLGFLSNVKKSEIEKSIRELINGQYTIEKRSTIELKCNYEVFKGKNLALNDFTLHKRDNSSMITIKTFLNGELFNTYWADGLIVATPTGSTGYSLSCGGPIIFPDSNSLVITPVAPHNLNVRPIVVSDNTVISFELEGRGTNFLGSLDSKSEIMHYDYQLAVSLSSYKMQLIKLESQNFIQTLHDKLMWGFDNRNS